MSIYYPVRCKLGSYMSVAQQIYSRQDSISITFLICENNHEKN